MGRSIIVNGIGSQYADDTVIMENKIIELQSMIDQFDQQSEQFNFHLNSN